MTDVEYLKYHGTGNDFAVVEADVAVPDRQSFSVALCDDLDADGVLFLAVDEDTDPVEVEMALYQPDGSTAAMCGNGARVAARWGAERTGAGEVLLRTGAGPRRATVHEDWSVTVEMGTPTFAPATVPVDRDGAMVEEPLEGYRVTAVNTGVPHAVAFVEDVAAIDIEADAPPIRHHEVFPEGANATFASAAPDGFDQRTFERGVEGETQSCGTGAVAIAAVAHRLGEVAPGEEIPIRPPGGDLLVTVAEEEPATLCGPTAFEFSGSAPSTPHED